ncbi:hypothetical protein SCLCIDRAFT_1207277 [Scleroderma citrinum Foug A]|uniref:Uncharacterized protein n=1 Tax=Scleroderma citrinum Foug A TaxID=1036808 RepID=A0A0C3EPA9_9AGAM|nr:hypothetical protein SCLCIDRAFT_1207277 [Scleroderma citrinum Foug A]
MSKSSLSAVVSNLVRASMGSSVPAAVPDEDLDKHVAELILKEAKQKAESYAKFGVQAYFPTTPDPNAPRTNKRFLSSIIRSTDDHNKTILRAQALAAQEIKQAREEEERKERKARAEEAAAAERARRQRGRRNSEEYGWRSDRDKDRHRVRDWSYDWRRQGDEDEHERERTERHRRRRHRSRSSERDRDQEHRKSRRRNSSRDHDSHRSEHRSRSRKHRHDGEERERHRKRRRRSSDSRSRSPVRPLVVRSPTPPSHTRTPSPPPPQDDQGSSSKPFILPKERSTPSPCRSSETPPDDSSIEAGRPAKGRHKEIGHTAPTSSSPLPRLPSPPPRRKRALPTSSTSVRPPSVSPPPLPPTALPSKMDKYFDDSYDPRLDVTPLTVPAVPKAGLINDAEYAAWDAMLELLRKRREDKEEKKRLEKLGFPSREIKLEQLQKRGSGEASGGDSVMAIEYKKRGSVREWDLGKEGL